MTNIQTRKRLRKRSQKRAAAKSRAARRRIQRAMARAEKIRAQKPEELDSGVITETRTVTDETIATPQERYAAIPDVAAADTDDADDTIGHDDHEYPVSKHEKSPSDSEIDDSVAPDDAQALSEDEDTDQDKSGIADAPSSEDVRPECATAPEGTEKVEDSDVRKEKNGVDGEAEEPQVEQADAAIEGQGSSVTEEAEESETTVPQPSCDDVRQAADENDGTGESQASATVPAKVSAVAMVIVGIRTRISHAPRLWAASFAGIAIALAGLGLVWTQVRATSIERNAVATAAMDATFARDRLLSAVIEGNCISAAIPSSDVADTSTTDTLSTALDVGRKSVGMMSDEGEKTADIIEPGDEWLTLANLTHAKVSNEKAVEVFARQERNIRDAIASVRQSSHDKRKADAKSVLGDSLAAGRTVLNDTDGSVDDAKYRGDLSAKVDAAQQVFDANADDIDAYGTAREALDAAAKACSDSHDRYVRSQQQAAAARRNVAVSSSARSTATKTYASKAEAQQAASTGGGTVSQRSDGTWYVSYRETDSRGTANADGSVSEWQNGYYIAHNWSNGGSKIASKPGTVSVNGRTYRYVSSINVPRSTTWQEVEGFVHANGGIGFQTCDDSTGGYLITHYEPVG